jgi:hypothetical protein
MGWDGGKIPVYEAEPSLLTRNLGGWAGMGKRSLCMKQGVLFGCVILGH